ncbi:MAG TPA: phosphoenolpyruvate carboxylase, partial [Coriobacteriia bacterium]|nr:phosphoenolpyruvate carboxylase [Coriobacteriia bacterium]
LADKPVTDQRVFLARSDTAMNYGAVSAALSNKIALARFDRLSESIGVRLHPIIGMGSAPFRGGLSPRTAEQIGAEYPSVVTFTVQSAFKFDHPPDQVRAACTHLRERRVGAARPIDEERALAIIDRYSAAYRARVVELAPQINQMAKHVPARRARKLHIGLFGYARELGGVTLPRAISFTCSLYSLGLPPELIAFDVLTADDLAFIRDVYPSFEERLAEALRYADPEGPLMTARLREAFERAGVGAEPHAEHLELVGRMRDASERGDTANMGDLLLRAAIIRRFLG